MNRSIFAILAMDLKYGIDGGMEILPEMQRSDYANFAQQYN